eukprot:7562227-Pyramimonas_sp.AAC.2
MRDERPQARDSDAAKIALPRPIHAAAAAQVDDGTVGKNVRSFSRGAAGGPSGLRPQHIKEAL